MICIYQLNFTEGTYIGKTTNLKARLSHHMGKDRGGTPLKEAWKTQGFLGHTVLEECAIEELDAREVYWISTNKPNLNILPGGETMSGLNHPRNKCTQEEVEEIVRLLELRFRYSVIAEQLNIPYSRVYDVCSGKTHIWATQHLDLTKYATTNKESLVVYDKDNIRHIISYGERDTFCTERGLPKAALLSLKDTFNVHGISLKPHKMFLVETPVGELEMTEPILYYELKKLKSPSYTIDRVINKRKESKGWKIIKEIPG